MICEACAWAADYGKRQIHERCKGCDCHHQPIDGEPRLKKEKTRGHVARVCGVCGKTVAETASGILRKHRADKYMPYCEGL